MTSIIESLVLFIRPLTLACICLLIFNASSVLQKLKLTLQGISYFFFCHDKSWKPQSDPFTVFEAALKKEAALKDSSGVVKGDPIISRKTIIFVRHGESTWNDTFNKGKHRSALVFALGFVPGLIKACLFEVYLVLSGKVDSWFYDSPLSTLGQSQIKELWTFLKKSDKQVDSTDETNKFIQILQGESSTNPSVPQSKLVSSSLRRALSTMAGGFRDRLERNPAESILVLPSLQEISRNPDTLSITPAYTKVTASWLDQEETKRATLGDDDGACDYQSIFNKQVDMSFHSGNKPIDTNGLKRMNEFCHVTFSSVVPEDYLIVGGHSIWFRSFFKTFLRYDSTHMAKKKKIVNAGCIAFTLMKTVTEDGTEKFMIDEDSIRVIYGGFS